MKEGRGDGRMGVVVSGKFRRHSKGKEEKRRGGEI
jgi:hypothetical protein